MSYQPFNYEPAGWKFFFEYHTVQGLLDTCGLTGLIAAVHRSDSPYWRSNDSAASLKYCKLTSIFCDTLSHVIMWPCCLFPIKTDFFFKKPLGRQPSGHYSCSQHPHENNVVPTQEYKERDRKRDAGFCQYKASTVLCLPQRQFANGIL